MSIRKNKYDSLVIGAGAGGLVMALVLGMSGRRVLLLEQAEKPGGALRSFYKNGFRLDAGFHFSGALQPGGIFADILKMLGIFEAVKPKFLDSSAANIFHFQESGKKILFPCGSGIRDGLKHQFPSEGRAIDRYFECVEDICAKTPSLQLATMHQQPVALAEDNITLKDYLDSITGDKLLKESLSALVMCHGSAPSEISMADNARLSQGFYQSIATLEGGGSALVEALLERIELYDIETSFSDKLQAMVDVRDKKVGGFVLESGRTIIAEECILTINPHDIAELLPADAFPKAFFSRVDTFKYTPGFFTVFAEIAANTKLQNPNSISSFYPVDNLDILSKPGIKGAGAMAVIHSESSGSNILTAFEPLYYDVVEQWKNSTLGKRSPSYCRWKEAKTAEIMTRIEKNFPDYRGKLKLITASTPLTYQHYLRHYRGAAYGIKQLQGQYNLLGQLRLRNLFVAGQSAIMPGVLGTAMASLFVAKLILGNNEFRKLLARSFESSL